jgi:dissimilatory sulfite reductase (desulfoviridin) alpha/beta subunit
MSQTIVLIYIASRLNRIHRMMEKLTLGLIRITEDLNNTIHDMQIIQNDIRELEDLLRTALRD